MSFIPVGPASRQSSLITEIIIRFYNSYCLLKCKKDRRDAGPTKTSQAKPTDLLVSLMLLACL